MIYATAPPCAAHPGLPAISEPHTLPEAAESKVGRIRPVPLEFTLRVADAHKVIHVGFEKMQCRSIFQRDFERYSCTST